MYRSSPVIRWRRYNDRYFLEGNKCLKCAKVYYPKAFLCACGSKDFSDFILSGKGKLLSFTEIKSAPEKFSDFTPYCIGVIELEEGPRICGQLADVGLKDLKIGLQLQASFRKFYESSKAGVIHYGAKFVPVF